MTKGTRLLAGVLLGAPLAPTTAAAAGDPAAEREQVRQRRAVLSGELDHLEASATPSWPAPSRSSRHSSTTSAPPCAGPGPRPTPRGGAGRRPPLPPGDPRPGGRADRSARGPRRHLLHQPLGAVLRGRPPFVRPRRGRPQGRAAMGELVARDDELVDALELAEAQLVEEEQAASEASIRAGGRREEAEERLGELDRSRAEQDRLEGRPRPAPRRGPRRGDRPPGVRRRPHRDHPGHEAAQAAAAAAAARANGGGGGRPSRRRPAVAASAAGPSAVG